ncbi:class I SAM-dependent methyltransferase [Paraburkholderia acidipaludis]|uniref:class I SAM-dependent methyltransferase n=1 Tax=Paraburkholderia acidipaludis TaxID=660537 RepID=UPI0004842CD9|nr:class I SAM-dependent methyltransferase [Paraburkholderia acidipaludis]
MDMQLPLDQVNRRAWTTRDALHEFTRGKKWTDAGEQAAFAWIARECHGQPLLDIGIGAGRTIPLMMEISSNYTGIDYTASLLDQARKSFPGLDLRHMDARDMAALPSDHYALTAFSWNGIDCVDYEDRERILEEMYRVTRPGGLVLFSTHNRGGPGFDERPRQLLPRFSINPLRFGWRVLRAARLLPFALYNYRRHLPLHRDYDGYSIRTAAAHMFGIVIVYTTLPEQRRQLNALGFDVDAVFGSCDGQLIAPEARTSDAWWLHFVARKPR